MKTLFTKILAGALLAGLFLNVTISVNGQTWNIPPTGSGTTTYIGTTSANDVIINAGGTTAERMRIVGSGTTAGNIGIGINAPTELVHLYGSAPYTLYQKNAGFGNGGIKFKSDGGTYSLFQDFYPAGGFGLHLTPTGITGTTGIHLFGNSIHFGIYTSTPHGIYHFNNSIYTTSQRIGDWVNGFWESSKFTVGATSGSALIVKSSSQVANEYVTKILCDINAQTIAFAVQKGGNNITYTNQFLTYADGRTVIGTGITSLPSGYKLYVADGILTEKVKVAVKTTTDWMDFVFDKSYNLMPLKQVEKYIDKNKHLPDVPSAEEMVNNGLDVAKMDAKLLQKIEELTLYMIEMNKNYEEIKEENKVMKKEIEQLKKK